MRKLNYKRGFGFIEAVIAVAITFVVLLGVTGALSLALRSSLANAFKVEASYLEEEGLEIVRILRDKGWVENIASQEPGTAFYLAFDGTWKATTTNTYIEEIFERKVVLDDVYRDSSQNIVTEEGTLDPNIKKVTVTVSYNDRGATTTRSLSTYLTNIFDN